MSALLQIGASPVTIAAARKAVLDIALGVKDPAVAIAALGAFKDLCAVHGVTITGCTFNGPAIKRSAGAARHRR